MNTNVYKFNTFTQDVNSVLSEKNISHTFKEFKSEILNKFSHEDRFCIIFKIKTSDGRWRSISTLQKEFDVKSSDDLLNIFINHWSVKSDIYHSLLVSKIAFMYKLIEPEFQTKNIIFDLPTVNDNTTLMPQGTTNLPNNRLFHEWGGEFAKINENTFKVSKGDTSFHISSLTKNEYSIIYYYKDNKIVEFTDIYSNDIDSNSFIRIIGKSEEVYKNGKCVFIKNAVKTKYIKSLRSDLSISSNIITMDLETRTINEVMIPICVSIFDGENVTSFYLEDYDTSDDLIYASLKYLLRRKYHGYRVYMHNFSNFDGIFTTKIMAGLKEADITKVIKRNGRIISLRLTFNLLGNKKYSLYFRDSLLLIPSSLKKLGKSFNVDVQKSIYPYLFVNNSDIKLDYVGKTPDFKYFDKISQDESDNVSLHEYNYYSKQFNNDWNLRTETIKYCENDVLSLYLIIKEFQKLMFKLFEADINNYPTLSSLTFSIYRMKYMKDNKIPALTGELYRDLRNSYTGGSVDVYKPVGHNIYRYDVNSLYPSVMLEFPSPMGNIYKFNGDISKFEKDPFGFFNVKVKTPENLHVPILQTRIRLDNGGTRTIAPTGEWTGWYFSEEINYVKELGYDIEILSGYTFQKKFIFKNFVEDLYKLKKESLNGSGKYIISKLLLNALYGRFGMSPDKEITKIFKGAYEISKFISGKNDKVRIVDTEEFGNDIQMISYTREAEDDGITYESINVAIASSITSYARIKMGKIKSEYSNNLYYSDTDSLDLDVELPKTLISNSLGDYKLELKFQDVIYWGPKAYAGKTYLQGNGKDEWIRIKGLKIPIKFDQVSKLSQEDYSVKFKQEKWYKDMGGGAITAVIEEYTVKATENKRKFIYENNVLSKTKPYNYINGKLTY